MKHNIHMIIEFKFKKLFKATQTLRGLKNLAHNLPTPPPCRCPRRPGLTGRGQSLLSFTEPCSQSLGEISATTRTEGMGKMASYNMTFLETPRPHLGCPELVIRVPLILLNQNVPSLTLVSVGTENQQKRKERAS